MLLYHYDNFFFSMFRKVSLFLNLINKILRPIGIAYFKSCSHIYSQVNKMKPLLSFGKKLNNPEKPTENLMEKGENVGEQHFLLFALYFQPFSTQISIFE